jgi:phosphoribosylformylglycinamidine cyclo-ligase
MDYKTAGVDIDEANAAKKNIASTLNANKKYMMNKVGAFASLINAELHNYRYPIIVMKTEEPGSKQLLAAEYNRMPSVCVDMINHLINDCIVTGAKPIAVQDAIICGKLVKEDIVSMVKAMSDACTAQGCELVGGETSEQPGVLNPGAYILTASIVGVLERSEVLDERRIDTGSDIVALQSSGPHTNGYTLIRKLLKDHAILQDTIVDGVSFVEAVLKPHRCYYKALEKFISKARIEGMAHITGGGIKENLNRILPDRVDAVVDLSLFPVLPVFKTIKNIGDIPQEDMLRTFNMGVGMVIVCDNFHTRQIIEHMTTFGISACKIGRTVKGTGKVQVTGEFNWGTPW